MFMGEDREPMEFYKSVLGGELTIQTYGDIGAGHALDGQYLARGRWRVNASRAISL